MIITTNIKSAAKRKALLSEHKSRLAGVVGKRQRVVVFLFCFCFFYCCLYQQSKLIQVRLTTVFLPKYDVEFLSAAMSVFLGRPIRRRIMSLFFCFFFSSNFWKLNTLPMWAMGVPASPHHHHLSSQARYNSRLPFFCFSPVCCVRKYGTALLPSYEKKKTCT